MTLSSIVRLPFRLGKRLFYRLEKHLYRTGVLSAKKLNMPDFMCVGVEKAGTTWLYENLRCHPSLFLPDRKELNYFNNPARFYGYPLAYYSSYFPSTTRVSGEVTPCAEMPFKNIRFLKKVIPKLKVILILRQPVNRAWSATLMHLIRAQKRTFDDLTEADFQHLYRTSNLLTKGAYDKILPHWEAEFPAEQLFIGWYDDLKNEPSQFLNQVFRFLEVDETTDWSNFPVDNRINTSDSHPMPKAVRTFLEHYYASSISYVKNRFPEKTGHW